MSLPRLPPHPRNAHTW